MKGQKLSRVGVSFSAHKPSGPWVYGYVMWCRDCSLNRREAGYYKLVVYRRERKNDEDIDYKITFTNYREFRGHLMSVVGPALNH